MKMKNNDKRAAVFVKPMTDNTQVHTVVDGCKVKMIFPIKTENTTINEVKRMMVGGVVKP